MIWLQTLIFILGIIITAATVFSAISTFVLPRSTTDRLTRLVFRVIRVFFSLPLGRARDFAARDRIMAYYAPFSLLALVPTWYALVGLGFACIYWALGAESWYQAFRLSGSSLLTLGYAVPKSSIETFLTFTEATLGLILVALLIAYLPTIYSAFSRREAAVTLLEVRAGNPPSAVEMLLRFERIHKIVNITEQWRAWETWFAEVEESHTSLPALVFFRSPKPDQSWVTAAGAVLDAAALTLSTVDVPNDPQAALCIRAGYLALRHIADSFDVQYNPAPDFPDDPISITQEEFERAYEQLDEGGVSLKKNRYQAWLDFAGWRVNYDHVLQSLASLTMAPDAPWSSDRAKKTSLPPVLRSRK